MLKRVTSSFLLFSLATCSVFAEEIRISASDLLADYIRAPLESFEEINAISLDIQSIGSLPALDNLRSDDVDLAIIAVPDVDSELREEFTLFPFAYGIAVIAVNVNNPIDEITLAHLGGIYGDNEEFNLNTWGDLGLSGWGSRRIKPLTGPSETSISLELFKHSVFEASSTKPSVAMVKDTEVEEIIAGDPASIAVMSGIPKNKTVKAIMVSETADSPAFGPSEDNVHYGDYPIRLAFYIAFNQRDAEKLKPVLRLLLGDEVAAGLRKNELFALPDTIRRKLIIDLDLEN
ncbi:MAG: PstS family phosphate ABC transporter substrate-binding protein [Lentimonas sp.]